MRVSLSIFLASFAAVVAAEAPARPEPAVAQLSVQLERMLATAPSAEGQPEPAGDVVIEFAPNGRAAAAVADARRAEQERDWRRAAELYQRLLDEVPHDLCSPGARLYVPIAAHVEERLAGLPPEGLAAYRQQVNRPAAELYDAATGGGATARLEQVASRFLLSSRGDDALDRLATGWLAHGEAGRALRAWRRLLRLCRDSDADLAAVAAKVAVCLEQLERPEAAKAFLERAAAILGPTARVTVAGQDRELAAFAAMLASATQPAALPFVGGEFSRSWGLGAAIRPGQLAWSDAVQPREIAEAGAALRARYALDADAGEPEPSVRVLPIVAAGRVLYPARAGLAARDLATGKLAWEWPWRPEGPGWHPNGPFAVPSLSVGHWSCSAGEGAVYCSVPFQVGARRNDLGVAGDLAAVDLRTGATRWRRLAAELWPADEAAGGWFVSAPLPCGERLVVGARRGAEGDEFHLCCLSARDGKVLWRTFIAGRPSDPLSRLSRNQPWFEGMPAEADGLVVACAGGGIVAAVELATGRIRWLARYDQVVTRRGWWRWYHRPHDGWRTTTPVVSGGVVYATPADSDFLYAIELQSGRMLWRREREDHRFLVGVREGRACLVGSEAACLDARGEVEWHATLPSPAVGRPALAGRVLHIPVAGGILFLDAATGGELAWVSWGEWGRAFGSTWTTHVASGDLVIAGARLLVATSFTLNVFSPLDQRAAVERQLAARPDDPVAHYARGQECHWEGDAAAAIESLERALDLAGRQPGAMDAALLADARRRLAACYSDLARGHERAGRADLALGACEAALRYAPEGPEAQALQLRAAALARALRRWQDALAMCHKVLADAEPGGATWWAARAEAEATLREGGRAAYAPFEAAAAAALKGGEAELLAAVRQYPNSLAAPAALVRLAELADGRGQAAEVRLWLHRLVQDYPEADAAPDALHHLAVRYAREGAVAMARGAVERLRRAYPRWQGGGEAAAGLDADAFLARHRAQAVAPVAAVAPKPPLRVEWNVQPSYGALRLEVAEGGAARTGRFFVLAGRSFECWSCEDGVVRWADRPGWIGIRIEDAMRRGGGVRVVSVVSEVTGAPAERAGLRSGDVLVSFDGKPLHDAQDLVTTCMERRGGETVRLEFIRDNGVRTVALRLGERPGLLSDDARLPPVAFVGAVGDMALVRKATRVEAMSIERGDVVWAFGLDGSRGQADGGSGRVSAVAPGVAVLGDYRGRVVALDPALGRPLWTLRLGEPVLHDVALGEHGLAIASSRPATVRLINPLDGRALFEVSEPHAVSEPVFVLDSRGRLCYAMGNAVGCYDAQRQQLAWATRIPNFAARQLWVAGSALVAHGLDDHGVEVLECRRTAGGEPAWSLALARGERLVLGDLTPDAFLAASRQAARSVVRRLEGSTGQVAWTRALERQEELVAWETSGPALVLGLTVADGNGRRRAEIASLDKLTGVELQRVAIGAGALAGLRCVGGALCAVVETEFAALGQPPLFADDVPAQPARFRVVRVAGER